MLARSWRGHDAAGADLALRYARRPHVRTRLAGQRLAAPELAVLEAGQTIRRAARAGRLDQRPCAQALSDLVALPVAYAPHRPLLDRVWQLRDDATASS